MPKSFYNLDYIIELNEKRVEQYTSAYQQVLGKLTNIILIYSALTIFLIPIIQEVFGDKVILFLDISFGAFVLLFAVSLYFTVALIWPKEVAYLSDPDKYYKSIRLQYEATEPDKSIVNKLIKASYITELEKTVDVNNTVFKQKSSNYYNALTFALLATIPFLLCLGYHIFQKDDKIQKIEIVKPIFQSDDKIHRVEIINRNNSCTFNKKTDHGKSKCKCPGCQY